MVSLLTTLPVRRNLRRRGAIPALPRVLEVLEVLRGCSSEEVGLEGGFDVVVHDQRFFAILHGGGCILAVDYLLIPVDLDGLSLLGTGSLVQAVAGMNQRPLRFLHEYR